MKKQYEIDMCSGPLFGKILLYALPLMFSSILQLLFNAADQVVVGRFAEDGTTALAAVGAPWSLVNLIVGTFVGLAAGATVLVSRAYGEDDARSIERGVHTSICVAAIGGVVLGVMGFFFSEPLLRLMSVPENVLPGASLYTKIYFCGMPASMLYNFGAAILRAVGDTRRPFVYLTLAGVCNVLLNLVLVIGFHLDVAGVAIATVTSQCISCVLVMRCLLLDGGTVKVERKKLHIHKKELMQILRVGIPTGIQSAMYSVSNMLIASSVNSFGDATIAGNTASLGVEGFVSTSTSAFGQAAMNFISQNMGAGKMDRVKRSLFQSLSLSMGVGLVAGVCIFFFRDSLISIYRPGKEDVILAGAQRTAVVALFYCILGAIEVLSGSLRGLGQSLIPMLISMCGVCGLRILWVYIVFPMEPTFLFLNVSYPVSWILTALGNSVCLIFIYRKTKHALTQSVLK